MVLQPAGPAAGAPGDEHEECRRESAGDEDGRTKHLNPPFREGFGYVGGAAGLLTRGSLPRRLPDPEVSGVVAGEQLPLQRRDRPGLAPGSLTVLL